MAKEEGPRQFIFGSKFPGFMLVIDPGGPKYNPETGSFIPKTPFKGVTFSEGVYSTTDPVQASEMRKHASFGKDFWEIKDPGDAAKVNIGRQIEVSNSPKSTTSTPKK